MLIGSGFALRKNDREYAGLLPAAGIAVLFLAIYGGHLYHHLMGVHEAGAAIIMVCGASLWLCRVFESDLFALFAVAGSYFAPFLLAGVAGSLIDVAIYYSAWSVVFSVFSVWHGRRLIYLLAPTSRSSALTCSGGAGGVTSGTRSWLFKPSNSPYSASPPLFSPSVIMLL
jgi:uncharacterized membrane protein